MSLLSTVKMSQLPRKVPDSRAWMKNWPPGVPFSIKYPRIPLHELLRNSARKYPSKTAILFYGSEISYNELDRRTDVFASALHRMGIRKGDRVALFLPNIPQFVISFYGALKAGAIVTSMSPLRKGAELGYELLDSGAETLIALDILFEDIQDIVKTSKVKNTIITNVSTYLPLLQRILVSLRGIKSKNFSNTDNFSDLLLNNEPKTPQIDIDPVNDTAIIQYTGGTTGKPKGVMLTHYNLVANAIQVDRWARGWGFSKKLRERILPSTICVIPFFHIYGLTAALNHGIFSGSKLILIPRFDVGAILNAIKKHRPSEFPAIPRFYSALLEHPDIDKFDFKFFQHCISGASSLPEDVFQRFKKLTGEEIIEGYGLTEGGPVVLCNPVDPKLRKIGSVGLPYPDTDSRIVDLEMGEFELAPREEGELEILGPQVMKGYWNKPEETEQTFHNGWLKTGDIAFMDEDGYFYIVDRKIDTIIRSGFRVVPIEVEKTLLSHPSVLEAAVVGIPDPYRCTTDVKAFVVLKKDAKNSLTESDLIKFCQERLEGFKVPGRIEFREDLPKNSIGKVWRRILREESTQMMANI